MKDAITIIKRQLKTRTFRDLAEEIGVKAPYLHDLVNGRRQPGPKIFLWIRDGARKSQKGSAI